MQRKYSLDFLKITATTFILFHHYQQYIGRSTDGLNFVDGKFYFGYMVELFFILSGFFMFPYVDRIYKGLTFKEFYIPRIKRLVPMLALTAVAFQAFAFIYYLKYHMLEGFFNDMQLWDLVVASVGMQKGWVFADTIFINNPAWYISVLLLCYLIFYLGVAVCRKLGTSSRYFFLAMIMWGIIINTYDIRVAFTNAYTARGYISFFTGLMLATYIYDRTTSIKENVASVFIVVTLSLLFVIKPEMLEVGFVYLLTFFFYPAIIIIFRSSIVEKIFNHKAWGFAADVAFNAFMWHFVAFIPLFMYIKAHMWQYPWYGPIGMLTYYGIMIVVGVLSKMFIQPLLGRMVKN
jgi:peptidoglycan/LPS O-acetylase OafA/YrhL